MDIPWPPTLSESLPPDPDSASEREPRDWGPAEQLAGFYAVGTSKLLERDARLLWITHAELEDSQGGPLGDYTEVLDLGPAPRNGPAGLLDIPVLTQPPPPAEPPMDEPVGIVPLPHVAKIAVTLTLTDGSSSTWVGAARARLGEQGGRANLVLSASAQCSGGTGVFAETRGVAGFLSNKQLPAGDLSSEEAIPSDVLLTLRLINGPPAGLSSSPRLAGPWTADREWILGYGAELNEMRQQGGESFLVARGEAESLDSRPMGHYTGSMVLNAPLNPEQLARPPADPTLAHIPDLPDLGDFKVRFDLGTSTVDLVGSGSAQWVPLESGDSLLSITADGIITGATGRLAGVTGVGCIQGSTRLPADFKPSPGMSLAFRTSFQLRTTDQKPQSPDPVRHRHDLPRESRQDRAEIPAGQDLSALLASLPPGVDPKTHGLAEVDQFMARIANLLLYGAAGHELRPIQDRGRIVGFTLDLALQRLDVQDTPPEPSGMRAANLVSSSTPARLRLDMAFIPDGYVARYGERPPSTAFDPTRPQRLAVLDGSLQLADASGSSLRFFGTGQTFPQIYGSDPLVMGLVLVIIDARGRLQGHPGMAVINGLLNRSGPSDFSVLIRLADPNGSLLAPHIPPIQHPAHPREPDSTFFILHGVNDVEDPTELIVSPDGSMQGAHLRQQISLVRTGFDVHGPQGLSTATTFGPLVSRLKARMSFDPMAPPPVPFTIKNSRFTFFDSQGRALGRLEANIVEGRGYPTSIPGIALPIQRGAALAPIIRGSGIFEGARGLVTVSNWISIFPRQVSGFFFIRLMDPAGRYRQALGRSPSCPSCVSNPDPRQPW